MFFITVRMCGKDMISIQGELRQPNDCQQHPYIYILSFLDHFNPIFHAYRKQFIVTLQLVKKFV